MTIIGLAKGTTMGQQQASELSLHDVERVYLERLRLATQVILDAAPELELVTDPLHGELVIFKERVEYLLLLPEQASDRLPWHQTPEAHRSLPGSGATGNPND